MISIIQGPQKRLRRSLIYEGNPGLSKTFLSCQMFLSNFPAFGLSRTTSLTFFLLFLFLFLATRVRLKWNSRQRLPPGPPGLPILGNLLQLGAATPLWFTFDKWKHEHGPIVHLNMAGQHIIVLNSKAAATELLEHRSAIYSDRPKNIVAEYIGSLMALPFARYGKLWQSMRRASHAVLNARVSTQYQPVQIDEAVILAHALLNDPSTSWLTKIDRSASTIISVVYGRNSKSLSSEKLEAAQIQTQPVKSDAEPIRSFRETSDALETLSNIAHRFTSAVYPGAYLVDILPILDYLPARVAKWKRDAKRDFTRVSEIFEKYFDEAVRNDVQQSTLCTSLAKEKIAAGLTSVEKAWVAGTISVAALSTTSTTLAFFLYAMILHPNVQEKAHLELDRVVGRSRNPTFADMAHLPYVRAIVKEILRWQPAIPLAVPHVAMEDDWYEGYLIPKGTSCIPNVWSINRDKEQYGPDADQFRPERFLKKKPDKDQSEGGYVLREEYESNDGHCAYGFGRR
ncbi:hypothetical protein D9757_014579 [Collybiopsis confluens]|uniref:Cytochrome P450 n=1 Tax=Collybiopsis confluens TaxID=2823264 RepID=A0A8H5CNE5_9AGAR|nr:hypothetical protein D9757_014579 [Collybiopsis confluens]